MVSFIVGSWILHLLLLNVGMFIYSLLLCSMIVTVADSGPSEHFDKGRSIKKKINDNEFYPDMSFCLKEDMK